MRPELKVIDGGCERALRRELESVMFALLKKHQPRFTNLLVVHCIDSRDLPPEISLLETIPVGPFSFRSRPHHRTLVSVVPQIIVDESGQRTLLCRIGDSSFQNDILDELFRLSARHKASRVVTVPV